MERTEALVARGAPTRSARRKVTFRGHEIDLAPPWQRVKFVEALEEKGVWSRDEAELRAKLEEAGVDTERDRTWSQLVDHAYSHFVEPELIQPTIVYDWPIELSPFARTTDEDETLVERFESVVGGMEFANAFSELNDAEEQAQRFAMQEAEREAGAEESEPGDPDYVEALSYGMPPTGGCGIGIDRLAMVLTGSDAIRDVILFPALRSRVMEPEQRYALDALLDALGLPFDESVPVEPAVLDEVFGLLTLAHERDAELDQHGRPLPPADPPGPRVAELAAGLGLERRGYPGGERFLVALTHDVDLLGGGGLPHRGAQARRLGRAPLAAAAARVDHVRGGRPARARPRLPARGDARRRGRARLDLLLPHAPGGAAGRLPGALRARAARPRSSERGGRGRGRAARVLPGARAARRDRRGGAAARRDPQGLRHHYLRSDPARLAAELREAGLRYDSSIGWPSLPGLRAGTPYPYRLWDAERREPGAWELPLVLMDATLAEERYLGLGADEAYEVAVARAGAGRRARRRGRDPLAPALAPPAALERLRPSLPAAARVDRGARRPGRLGRGDARPLGG